ncbi:long-chain fatty acid--CoA ligase [Salinirarus marinus]|uniref:long-chain fatty acid--CoA ligase n=1 Tax=Salinirarus marinus TaxID=3068310 RepID=UPI003C6C9F9A
MAGSDLTLRPFLWRAANLFPEKEVVSRTHRGRERYTYGAFDDRVNALANALDALGVGPGARVGTLGWNHHRHFEAYYAVPLMGAQLHTVNVQLSDDHTEYIVNDAADDLLLVDPGGPVETLERVWDDLESPRAVVVMDEETPALDVDVSVHAYEDLLADHAGAYGWPDLDESQPAAMCYTSGTTGRPKGVEYTHKMMYAHAMMVMTPAALDVAEGDVVMPVVPMFHVNSWEFPFAATMIGAKQVYPGPSPDAETLVSLIRDEGVTLTAGVPTVWINVLDYLDEHDESVPSLERIVVGGSAAPEAVMRRYEDEYGVVIDHAWGMTETMSIGSVSRPKSTMAGLDSDEIYAKRAKQGLLSPGLEMKVVDAEAGERVPWDGESAGELYVRGATVTRAYYDRPEANAEEFEDGWLKTGDIVTVDGDGYIDVVDRAKDVIKSGGEWISSIELENALMGHDAVAEAAVVAVDHAKWRERPVAYAVRAAGEDVTGAKLREFLADDFPTWWLPDNVVFVESVPKTATGKFDKKRLREETDDPDLVWTPGK